MSRSLRGPSFATTLAALSSSFQRDGRREGAAATEGLRLSAQEWAAFTPPQTAVGIRWTIPPALARRFCRALSPYSEPTITPQPEHVKSVELTATVESVRGDEARVRLEGRWETELTGGEQKIKVGKIRSSATAEGILLHDVKEKAPRSLLLVFSAEYRHHDEPPQRIGALVEWRANPEPADAGITPPPGLPGPLPGPGPS